MSVVLAVETKGADQQEFALPNNERTSSSPNDVSALRRIQRGVRYRRNRTGGETAVVKWVCFPMFSAG
jgi:hypothetical protein